MGNAVYAASKSDSLGPSDQDKKESTEGPGSIENIHNKARDVFPVPFSGAKLVVNKGLSPNFQANHTLTLSSHDQSGYKFGVTYVGHNKVSDTETYPVLMSEIHPNGHMQAQLIHRMSPLVYLRYIAQLQPGRILGQQATTEFRTPRTQTSLTVISPDLEKKQVMGAIDYMCQLSKHLSLGSMFFYQRSPQIPINHDGIWCLGGRYAADKWQACATIRPWQYSFHTSLHVQVNENLQLAAELESSFQQQINTTSLGYKYDIPKANVSFKAQIDSNWDISSSLEKKLVPFPFTFTLSAMGNQTKSKYAFGIGLLIG